MLHDKKIGVVIPTRYDSSRLPGKVLLPFLGKPNLQHIIERVRRSGYVDEVILAIAHDKDRQKLIDFAKVNDCKYYVGNKSIVIGRTLAAANQFNIDIIVDMSHDCTLVDPDIIDNMLLAREQHDADYVSNAKIRTYPDGFDIQVYTTKIYEHVFYKSDITYPIHTGWNIEIASRFMDIKNVPFITKDLQNSHPDIRMVLDTEEDYKLLTAVFEHFGHNEFGWKEATEYVMEKELWRLTEKVITKHYSEG